MFINTRGPMSKYSPNPDMPIALYATPKDAPMLITHYISIVQAKELLRSLPGVIAKAEDEVRQRAYEDQARREFEQFKADRSRAQPDEHVAPVMEPMLAALVMAGE